MLPLLWQNKSADCRSAPVFHSAAPAAAFSSSPLGNTRFRRTATMKTTATQFSANTLRSSSGNMWKICGVCVNPSPMERDRAAILIFLCEYPQRLIICTPDTTMEPNIISVQPPRTASGSDANPDNQVPSFPVSCRWIPWRTHSFYFQPLLWM